MLRDFAIENKIAIATDWSMTMCRSRNRVLTLNPDLSKIHFQKILDPFRAYQELEQWIGGVLTNTEVIPEQTDKNKVTAHGFDKWSFRKHKLDKQF